jgi:hypothetical protein
LGTLFFVFAMIYACAAFVRANQLGARATALKRQFLREYWLRRQIATGLSRSSLPQDF